MNTRSTVAATALLALGAMAGPAAAQVQVYGTVLSGANESPPVASSGGGAAIVSFDLGLKTMRLQTTFAGLTGNVSAAHIHCCTATPGAGTVGVASQTPSFSGFPLGASFGAYDHSFDMALSSSYNPAFLAANGGSAGTAFSALLAGIDAGRAYLNIHTSFAPGGEIRGFLAPVPEPSAYALMLAGLAVLGWRARSKRSA